MKVRKRGDQRILNIYMIKDDRVRKRDQKSKVTNNLQQLRGKTISQHPRENDR